MSAKPPPSHRQARYPMVSAPEAQRRATLHHDRHRLDRLPYVPGSISHQAAPDSWLAAAYRMAIIGLGRSPLAAEAERGRQSGSTDMGNVTQVLPAIHPTIAIDCGDAVNHQPEFATACATPSADRAVCDGALALALTGLAAATDDAQRERLIGAQREWLIGRVRQLGRVSRRRGASVTAVGGAA